MIIAANPRVVPTQKICELGRSRGSIPPLSTAARRKMSRTWEMSGVFCTGCRETCRKTYIVSLQLISILVLVLQNYNDLLEYHGKNIL